LIDCAGGHSLSGSPASIARSVDSESVSSVRSYHSPLMSKRSVLPCDADTASETAGSSNQLPKILLGRLTTRLRCPSPPLRSPFNAKDKLSSKLSTEATLHPLPEEC
jgi:hypothetical protein